MFKSRTGPGPKVPTVSTVLNDTATSMILLHPCGLQCHYYHKLKNMSLTSKGKHHNCVQRDRGIVVEASRPIAESLSVEENPSMTLCMWCTPPDPGEQLRRAATYRSHMRWGLQPAALLSAPGAHGAASAELRVSGDDHVLWGGVASLSVWDSFSNQQILFKLFGHHGNEDEAD